MSDLYGDSGYGDVAGLSFFGAPDPFPPDILDFDELTNYYIALLIIQYFNKSKAQNTVGTLVKNLLANRVLEQVRDGFNLDTATGKQLDALASYRGASRSVYGLDLSRSYFSLPAYDDPDAGSLHGFAEYGDLPTWFWILYADAERPVYSLTDDELRRLVKFLAKTHSRNLTMKEIDDVMYEFFGSYVNTIDNGDMSVTYHHDPADPDTLFNIIYQTGNLPRPAGVAVSVT